MAEKIDEMCQLPKSSSISRRTEKSEANTIEMHCTENLTLQSARQPETLNQPENGTHAEATQTLRNASMNTDIPNSLTTTSKTDNRGEPLEKCEQKTPISPTQTPRNPITGLGLNGDGVGGLKPKKLKPRDGNPVTGEGYKPSNDFHNHTPSMNGANEIINKNRIPPGGYSSGLW